MKILLTGGTGFIGSHTAVSLLERGYEVILLDNFSNSTPDVAQRVQEITGNACPCCKADLRDKDSIAAVFSRHPDIASVFHFAGYKASGESVSKAREYYENNVVGTLNLLGVMDQYEIRNLIFSSSAAVYCTDNEVPYREDDLVGAANPYGRAKVMIEQILRDVYVADPRWSLALLRYFNPIGAHPSGLIGEDPRGIPNNLLPYIARVAAGELEIIHVYGDDYDTPDGTGVRDYIHVMDLAEGHVLTAKYLENRKGVHTFNLGTGKGSSVLDVIAAFEKACGQKLPRQIDARRPGDPATVYADTTFARAELGFKAEYSLDEMCRDVWNWQSHRL
jgi:UDP-glucose 4-epimerase